MKISVLGLGYCPQIAGQGGPRDPQYSISYHHCSWFPSELDGETLLLKIQHILVAGHSGWNKSSWDWAEFFSVRRCKLLGRDWASMVSPVFNCGGYNTNLSGKVRPPMQWWHSSSGSPIAFWMDLRPVQWEWFHTWHYKPDQREIIVHGVGGPPTAVILRGHYYMVHAFKMPS